MLVKSQTGKWENKYYIALLVSVKLLTYLILAVKHRWQLNSQLEEQKLSIPELLNCSGWNKITPSDSIAKLR
jgi:hypothetical protein